MTTATITYTDDRTLPVADPLLPGHVDGGGKGMGNIRSVRHFLVACVQQSALPPDGPALLREMEPQRPPVAE